MSHRLLRLLLLAYPRPFRERYGDDLAEGWEALRMEAAGDGVVARVRFWLRAGFDILRSGARERLSTRGYRLGTSGVRLPGRGARVWLRDLRIDLRYALRTLGASPGYVAGVTLTLALGIGANTALFSVVWGVFGRPLPFADGNELVRVASVRPGWTEGMTGDAELSISVPELEELRAIPVFEDVAEYHRMQFTLVGPGGPTIVSSAVVSSNYFDFLGMEPMLGRLFDPVEDSLGAHPVIVLSHPYWLDAFAGDAEVVGSTVRMNGTMHEVVGVLPRIPQFPSVNDIYLPISMCPLRSDPAFMADRDGRLLTAYARLEDGATHRDGRAAVDSAMHAMHAAHPGYAEIPGGHELRMATVREELVAGARPVMWPLIGVSLLLLFVACANAGGFALTRASRRVESLAVRSAMGAGRGRLARQLLTETALLGVVGGLVGIGIAVVGSDLLATFAERFTSRAQEVRVDGVVLGFAALTSLASGIAFGLAPVTLTSRLSGRLGRAGRASTGRTTRRVQHALVGMQVAVAFAVVAGAGLLLRSFWAADSVAIGIDTESVVSARFAGGSDRYPTGLEMNRLLDRVRDRLAEDEHVLSSARVPFAPLADPHVHRDGYWVQGTDGEWHAAVGDARALDVEYFETLGIERVAGRLLTEDDGPDAPRVVVVNRTFFERYVEGVAGLGAIIRACDPERPCAPPARIVGVVEDVRLNGAEFDVLPEVYLALNQTDRVATVLVARVTGSPDAALARIVELAQSYDPELAVRDAGTLEEFRRETVAPRRFLAGLLLAFGAVAAGLALTGVFGVTSLAVAARSREIGIRRALGASDRQAERLVLREGLAVVFAGWSVGLLLTLATGWLLEGLLFQVRPTDPPALAATAVFFLLAAGVACVLPARRVARARIPDTLSAP